MSEANTMPPGATLAMLGGGQLGRMFTVAARTLGYRVHVLDPDPASPAGALAHDHLCAAFTDAGALDALARTCAAVTTEFENVPAEALERLARACIVRPGAAAVAATQNRLHEKAFFAAHGLPTVAWAAVPEPARDANALDAAVAAVGTPALLKRAAGGYDGKGQAGVDTPTATAAARAEVGPVECILEQRVALARELSVIVCRAADATVACYPPGENRHEHGILATTHLPAAIDDHLANRAQALAAETAAALDYVGVLGVELFVTTDGEVLLNELAPRPHNSGHYTLNAAATSQFEQQVRLLCGYAPASTALLSPVAMVNLLGDLWGGGEPDWDRVFAAPGAHLHLYGKNQPRPGRKMGHINVLADDAATARDRTQTLHADLAAR
jgi:5-(carboxyamino)imidazole ribonucleotide synthase